MEQELESPFVLYRSPGPHEFDYEHTFGTITIEESDVEAYIGTGKWFMNSRDAVDAFIRSQEVDEDEGSNEEETKVNEEPEKEVAGIPDWATEEEINQVKIDDNETADHRHGTRRARNKSSNV